MVSQTNRIAFQGDFGANSDMASRDMFPAMEPLPCPTFEMPSRLSKAVKRIWR